MDSSCCLRTARGVEEWRSGGVECWLDRVKIGFGVEPKYSFRAFTGREYNKCPKSRLETRVFFVVIRNQESVSTGNGKWEMGNGKCSVMDDWAIGGDLGQLLSWSCDWP